MKYSVSIELKKAAKDDYRTLHNEMATKNFYQFIKTDKYSYEGSKSKIQLLQTIQEAVLKTGKEASVQIIEMKNWFGFEKPANIINANINSNIVVA